MVNRILIGLLALLVAAGGFYLGSTLANRRAAAEALEADAGHATAIAASRADTEHLATTLATGEAEAVLRAFAAGLTPSLLAERRESVEISAVALLRVSGVLAVDIFRPDGSVVYSSDAKLMTTGLAAETDQWALGVTELMSRSGDREGTLVLATPVVDAGQTLAVIRLGFDLQVVQDAATKQRAATVTPAPTAT